MGPDFVHVEGITGSSQFMDATIKNWFASMTNQERNQLVEEMYALLSTGTAEHASDVFQPKNILTYAKTLSGDADMRHLLSEEFQGLITAARKAYTTMSSKSLPAGKEK